MKYRPGLICTFSTIAKTVDLVDFQRELKGVVNEWANEHATYRNPDDESEYWYSPAGKGNPPKWMKNVVSDKPKKTKKAEDVEAWMKKAEKFKVKTEAPKKAA